MDDFIKGFIDGVLYVSMIFLVLLTFMWAAQGEPSSKETLQYCVSDHLHTPSWEFDYGRKKFKYERRAHFEPCDTIPHEEDI